MPNRTDILQEIKTVIAGIPGLVGVYVYPDEYDAIPANAEPVAIVEELRAIANSTSVIASGCAISNWQASILIIVARGIAQYPSKETAVNDILAGNFEQLAVTALLGASLPDSVLVADMVSSNSWFQWEKSGGDHEPVWAVRVLVPIAQEIYF